jgi:deoxycytidine triphosphate deaminase
MKAIVNPKHILEQNVVYSKDMSINESEQLQQSGIDLRLKKAYRITGAAEFRLTTSVKPSAIELQLVDNCYLFKAGEQYSLDFVEDVSVPEDMAALIINRSSINRNVGFCTSGLFDPGYRSQGGCGAMFRPTIDVKIEKGFRMAQIVFFRSEAASLYNGQYQDSKEKADLPK